MTHAARIAASLLAALGLGASSGCLAVAAAGAGAGTYAYLSGSLEKTLEAPIERVHGAALAAVEDLGYTTTEQTRDALESRITARQADDTRVRITLEGQSENLTKTTIRIGVFGNEAQSLRLLEAIESRL